MRVRRTHPLFCFVSHAHFTPSCGQTHSPMKRNQTCHYGTKNKQQRKTEREQRKEQQPKQKSTRLGPPQTPTRAHTHTSAPLLECSLRSFLLLFWGFLLWMMFSQVNPIFQCAPSLCVISQRRVCLPLRNHPLCFPCSPFPTMPSRSRRGCFCRLHRSVHTDDDSVVALERLERDLLQRLQSVLAHFVHLAGKDDCGVHC